VPEDSVFGRVWQNPTVHPPRFRGGTLYHAEKRIMPQRTAAAFRKKINRA
jgi:hypothetical protein